MRREKVKDYAAQQAAKQMLRLLPHFSNQNLVKMASLAERIAKDEDVLAAIGFVKKLFEEGHPAVGVARKIIERLSPRCREKIASNLFINAMFKGSNTRMMIEKEEGFCPPFSMLLSPTMRCNLHCFGCYAGEYTREDDLEYDVVSSVLSQAKELGIYFASFVGGEPFLWDGLMSLFAQHSDMYFQVYTNGTLMKEKTISQIEELGNVAVMVSIEGGKEQTDRRRKEGVFEKAMRVMEHLAEAGVVFGASITVTKENLEEVTSSYFVDLLMEKGALIVWYFLYMPVGRGPDLSLMPTPEQRLVLKERVHHFRATRSIFIVDFWNDAPSVEGCIAGGKHYFHINHKGDIEPCVFVHFATHNIKHSSLKEALNSPFFRMIREKQPFSPNLLTPCMILDNPQVLRQIIKEVKASPTHPYAETLLNEYTEFLDDYGKRIHQIMDPVWEREYVLKPCIL
jgi:MoaA/NifB/PqqE/SkfB family radical SAM enzyme